LIDQVSLGGTVNNDISSLQEKIKKNTDGAVTFSRGAYCGAVLAPRASE
jgi:hypothetical protein